MGKNNLLAKVYTGNNDNKQKDALLFSWHGLVQSENFDLTYCIHTYMCVHVYNMNICIFLNLRLVQMEKKNFLIDVLSVAVI